MVVRNRKKDIKDSVFRAALTDYDKEFMEFGAMAKKTERGLAAQERRKEFFKARGMQPKCRRCRHKCKVLKGSSDLADSFVCYDFEERKK